MFQSLKKKLGYLVGRVEESEKIKEGREEKKKVEISKKTRLKHLFKEKIKLSEKELDKILFDFQLELIQADVAFETSEKIMEELKKKLLSREIPKRELRRYIKNSLRDVLENILKTEEVDFLNLIREHEKPFKIIFFGINGGGKTTTIAKIAKLLQKNNFSLVLAAGDTFRAGGIEQIEKHAQRLGVKVIKHQKGADSAAVIYDAVEHAQKKNIDVVLADTAGRMQTNVNLMDEMKKICRVNKPDLKIFVGDALAGNDAVSQAKMFNQAVGIDGIILTKLDADPKGGCAISIIQTIKKPILFVGVGQGYHDLMKFDKDWFIKKILEENEDS